MTSGFSCLAALCALVLQSRRVKRTILPIALIIAIVLGCFAGIVIISPNVKAATIHEGHITQDETWTASGNPHYVVSSVTVDQGVTLIIDPGTEMYFDSDTGLYVEGNLTVSAANTTQSPVLFTSNDSTPSSGDWHGIQFNSTADDYSTICGAIIQYANVAIWLYYSSPYIFYLNEIRYNNWGIFGWFSTPWIIDNSIHDNGGDGVQIGGFDWERLNHPHDESWPSTEPVPVFVEENNITGNGMRGVKFWDQGAGAVTPFNVSSNRISGNGWEGVASWTGSGIVLSNNIVDNGGGGIHFSEFYPSDGITVTNNTVVGNGAEGIVVMDADATIVNNTVDQHDLFGVYLWNSKATLLNNSIQHTEHEAGPNMFQGFGVRISDSIVEIRDNEILYNTHGIRIQGQDSSVSVVESNISSNRYLGIDVAGGWFDLCGNTLYSNAYSSYITHYAISVHGGSNGTIQSNEITYNYNGIAMGSGTYPIVTNNTIENNTKNGLYVNLAGTHPEVLNNSVVNNSYGIRLAAGGNATVHGNNIYDNAQYGMYNSDSSVMVNATDNWWGHASGPHDDSTGDPDYNPYGQGDDVSDYIIYRPWLHNPAF